MPFSPREGKPCVCLLSMGNLQPIKTTNKENKDKNMF
jgi:hypothetical protein